MYNKNCNCNNDADNNNCFPSFSSDRSIARSLNCICNLLREFRNQAPSYGVFWQSEFVTVALNDPFPFNFTGPNTPDISLSSPTTINVQRSGVYQINFRVAVNVSANDNPSNVVDQRVSLYINDVQQPNTQASFGFLAADSRACFPLSGDAIVFIPANATLELRNDGNFTGSSPITTCDNGVNAVTFNIVRLG